MISKRLVRLFKKKLGNLSFLDDLSNFLMLNTIKDHPATESLRKLPILFEQVDVIFSELDEKIVLAEINLHNSTTELADSNKDLYDLNLTMGAMVNSLDEAFLIFDEKGVCNNLYSKKCEDFFDDSPAGVSVLDILLINDREDFHGWLKHLFSGVLDFEDLVELGPDEFYNSDKQLFISLKYKPIFSNSGELKSVVLIGKDITSEKEALEKAQNSEDQSNMILRTIQDWDSFVSFFDSYKEFVDQLKKWDFSKNTNDELIRILHTIKGTASSLSIAPIRNFVHTKETQFLGLIEDENFSLAPFVIELVKDLDKIKEDLFRKNHLIFKRYIHGGEKDRRIKDTDLKSFYNTLVDHRCSNEIVDSFFSNLLEINVKSLFESFGPRVHTASQNQKKKIVFNVTGDATLTIAQDNYKFFLSNFTHLLINCIYHGIELPELRTQLGKSSKGSIIVSFKEENYELVIEVFDDGAGIDTLKLKEKLLKNGVDISSYSQDDLIESIFLDGVSTEDNLNQTAGRGVGMSSLKQSILDLNGSISVKSKLGKGSEFLIKLPLHRGKEYLNL